MILAVSASASVQSQTSNWAAVDDLLITSWQIRQTFDTGLQLIGGAQELALQGFISPTGVLDTAALSQADADAYNAALAAMMSGTYVQGAQSYLDQQVIEANSQMNVELNNYVQSASKLITATSLNYELQIANNDANAFEVEAIANTIEAAPEQYTITTGDVESYNNTLPVLETSIQEFAAFTAAANDDTVVAAFDQQAQANGVYFENVSASYYNASTNNLDILFAGQTSITLSQDLSAYLRSVNDVYLASADSSFYTTGPTQSTECFVNGGCSGAPSNGSGDGPPPNVTLYSDTNGDGVMEPTGYTDANGNVINYVGGDQVYHRETGDYLGYYDGGSFVCDSGSNLCAM